MYKENYLCNGKDESANKLYSETYSENSETTRAAHGLLLVRNTSQLCSLLQRTASAKCHLKNFYLFHTNIPQNCGENLLTFT